MRHLQRNLFFVPFFLSVLLSVAANAEPAQYCKFGSPFDPGSAIDFCMGTHMYHNVTTNDYDMYLTMTVSRQAGQSTGWTAIGTGATMQGSLMFIIYGDPLGKQDPIVSIRTANGHQLPRLLTQSDMPLGMDLRVIRSSWLPDDSVSTSSNSYTAWMSVVCYSCRLWPGASVSAETTSQPWIWAWNPSQNFDVYTFDAHLLMHKHHAGAGGWGTFYTDMKSTISTAQYPPSLPPIRPGVATLGSSDRPMSTSGSVAYLTLGANSYLHGLVMAICFILLFPGGVLALRSGSPKSFSYHWILQLCASILLILGLVLGLMKPSGKKINTTHQFVGLGIASLIGIQGLLGWWHHRRFVRLHRRTWVSYAHIWIGRLIMIFGWVNIMTGLLLRGYAKKNGIVITVAFTVCFECFGLAAWVWWTGRRGNKSYEALPNQPVWADAISPDAFALSTSDDEEDDDEKDESVDDALEKERK